MTQELKIPLGRDTCNHISWIEFKRSDFIIKMKECSRRNRSMNVPHQIKTAIDVKLRYTWLKHKQSAYLALR